MPCRIAGFIRIFPKGNSLHGQQQPKKFGSAAGMNRRAISLDTCAWLALIAEIRSWEQ
jgi:hypothetical protein